MPSLIEPAQLKLLREKNRFTQDTLAKASKIGVATIKRIEAFKRQYVARESIAERLAKALGVDIDVLSQMPNNAAEAKSSPETESAFRSLGYRRLGMMIDPETRHAFNMVEHLYGISMKSQILMAPLFAALLIEGSFSWRRKRMEAIQETIGKLRELAGGHVSWAAKGRDDFDEGFEGERESILARDTFGENVAEIAFDCGYDPTEENPFADYLQLFAAETWANDPEAKNNSMNPNIHIESGFGYKIYGGLPSFAIGASEFYRLTKGDPYAEHAIKCGHMRIKDIPPELLLDDREADRLALLKASIPAEELPSIVDIRNFVLSDEQIADLRSRNANAPMPTPQGDAHG